ncbi:unnamed protein product [Amoebophrya sp. A25]|nr:unnamed protein product [Amoebophrya sp. A25]|eukprot:GSA25T00006185001.1
MLTDNGGPLSSGQSSTFTSASESGERADLRSLLEQNGAALVGGGTIEGLAPTAAAVANALDEQLRRLEIVSGGSKSSALSGGGSLDGAALARIDSKLSNKFREHSPRSGSWNFEKVVSPFDSSTPQDLVPPSASDLAYALKKERQQQQLTGTGFQRLEEENALKRNSSRASAAAVSPGANGHAIANQIGSMVVTGASTQLMGSSISSTTVRRDSSSSSLPKPVSSSSVGSGPNGGQPVPGSTDPYIFDYKRDRSQSQQSGEGQDLSSQLDPWHFEGRRDDDRNYVYHGGGVAPTQSAGTRPAPGQQVVAANSSSLICGGMTGGGVGGGGGLLGNYTASATSPLVGTFFPMPPSATMLQTSMMTEKMSQINRALMVGGPSSRKSPPVDTASGQPLQQPSSSSPGTGPTAVNPSPSNGSASAAYARPPQRSQTYLSEDAASRMDREREQFLRLLTSARVGEGGSSSSTRRPHRLLEREGSAGFADAETHYSSSSVPENGMSYSAEEIFAQGFEAGSKEARKQSRSRSPKAASRSQSPYQQVRSKASMPGGSPKPNASPRNESKTSLQNVIRSPGPRQRGMYSSPSPSPNSAGKAPAVKLEQHEVVRITPLAKAAPPAIAPRNPAHRPKKTEQEAILPPPIRRKITVPLQMSPRGQHTEARAMIREQLRAGASIPNIVLLKEHQLQHDIPPEPSTDRWDYDAERIVDNLRAVAASNGRVEQSTSRPPVMSHSTTLGRATGANVGPQRGRTPSSARGVSAETAAYLERPVSERLYNCRRRKILQSSVPNATDTPRDEVQRRKPPATSKAWFAPPGRSGNIPPRPPGGSKMNSTTGPKRTVAPGPAAAHEDDSYTTLGTTTRQRDSRSSSLQERRKTSHQKTVREVSMASSVAAAERASGAQRETALDVLEDSEAHRTSAIRPSESSAAPEELEELAEVPNARHISTKARKSGETARKNTVAKQTTSRAPLYQIGPSHVVVPQYETRNLTGYRPSGEQKLSALFREVESGATRRMQNMHTRSAQQLPLQQRMQPPLPPSSVVTSGEPRTTLYPGGGALHETLARGHRIQPRDLESKYSPVKKVVKRQQIFMAGAGGGPTWSHMISPRTIFGPGIGNTVDDGRTLGHLAQTQHQKRPSSLSPEKGHMHNNGMHQIDREAPSNPYLFARRVFDKLNAPEPGPKSAVDIYRDWTSANSSPTKPPTVSVRAGAIVVSAPMNATRAEEEADDVVEEGADLEEMQAPPARKPQAYPDPKQDVSVSSADTTNLALHASPIPERTSPPLSAGGFTPKGALLNTSAGSSTAFNNFVGQRMRTLPGDIFSKVVRPQDSETQSSLIRSPQKGGGGSSEVGGARGSSSAISGGSACSVAPNFVMLESVKRKEAERRQAKIAAELAEKEQMKERVKGRRGWEEFCYGDQERKWERLRAKYPERFLSEEEKAERELRQSREEHQQLLAEQARVKERIIFSKTGAGGQQAILNPQDKLYDAVEEEFADQVADPVSRSSEMLFVDAEQEAEENAAADGMSITKGSPLPQRMIGPGSPSQMTILSQSNDISKNRMAKSLNNSTASPPVVDYSSVPSVLGLKEPAKYMEKVKFMNEIKELRSLQAEQERAQEEMKECSFNPFERARHGPGLIHYSVYQKLPTHVSLKK